MPGPIIQYPSQNTSTNLTPINNGVLTNDFDGAGHSILNLGGLTIPYGQILDIFIAIRIDGHSGSGSQIDPLDGSTQAKFDAIFAGYYNSVATNVHFHLGPGLYRTLAVKSPYWYPLAGWNISGAGMYLTTIQAAGPLSGPFGGSVINANLVTKSDNVRVRLLTTDCNWAELQATATPNAGEFNAAVGGVGLCGNNCLIDSVRTINSYGSLANLKEGFDQIILGPVDNSLITNAIIRNCISELPLGNYGSPFAQFATDSGIVEHCVGNGRNGGIDIGYTTGGVNLANNPNMTVGSNKFSDCGAIVYCDTSTQDGLTVIGNEGVRLQSGVQLVSAGTKNRVTITKNIIRLQNRTGASPMVGIATNNGQATDLVVTDNSIHYDGTSVGTGQMNPLQIQQVTRGLIERNYSSDIIPAAGCFNYFGTLVNVKIGRNTTFSGQPVIINNLVSTGYLNLDTLSDDVVQFSPAGIGWYRIGMSQTGNLTARQDVAGFITILGPGRVVTAFHYHLSGFNIGGVLHQVNQGGQDAANIDQVRGSTNGGNTNEVWLDIHITTASTSPISIYSVGPGRINMVAAPVIGAAAGGGPVILTLNANGPTTNGNYNSGTGYNVGTTQVVGARDTGWTAASGTQSKGAINYNTATLAQLAARMAALDATLTNHGLIGT